MSNEAITAVSKAAVKPSGRKFVLLALADYADEAWSCFPSVTMLARYTSQGEKTVRDHLDALEAEGVITRERSRNDDGTLGRYRFKIQRRKLPVADFATGEKQPSPAADFAGHNPQYNPQSSSSLRSDDCPEPERSAPARPASPTAIELPSNTGEMVPISEAEVADWEPAYPAVNVRQQLSAMRSWLNANPKNRKTHNGMRRFIVAWLGREQNRAPRIGPSQPRSGAPPPRERTISDALCDITGEDANETGFNR